MKTIIMIFGIILISSFMFGCIETEPQPIYKTITHNDPIYETLYTIELDDDGDGCGAIIVNNVYDFDFVCTGEDFWGYDEYMVTIYDSDGYEYKTYYEINSIDVVSSYEEIVGYNTWTEEVVDRYE